MEQTFFLIPVALLIDSNVIDVWMVDKKWSSIIEVAKCHIASANTEMLN